MFLKASPLQFQHVLSCSVNTKLCPSADETDGSQLGYFLSTSQQCGGDSCWYVSTWTLNTGPSLPWLAPQRLYPRLCDGSGLSDHLLGGKWFRAPDQLALCSSQRHPPWGFKYSFLKSVQPLKTEVLRKSASLLSSAQWILWVLVHGPGPCLKPGSRSCFALPGLPQRKIRVIVVSVLRVVPCVCGTRAAPGI